MGICKGPDRPDTGEGVYLMSQKRIHIYILTAVAAAVLSAAGCGHREEQNAAKKPVVVTLWHGYNAVVKAEFDNLVMEFNETVGQDQGIIVDAVGYGSSSELDEVLYASASHVIGSEPLPDIFASYPDSAYRLDKILPLVHLDDYFTEEELSGYRPEFLAEGVWEKGVHRMIPVAKSTEILYLNQTDWDVFSRETGAKEDMLRTWEGLARAGEMYYEWSGGSPFLGINAHNDFAALTAAQLGEGITREEDGGSFRYSRETARRVWEVCYVPHIKGWYESSVYNQDGIKSGRLMAYIGSSAGAGFFPQVVIKNENVSHHISCRTLAYPVFQDGISYMSQRGANMAVIRSDESHEEAAAEFLKWFTQPEQNIRFAVSTGYLPVQKKALESVPDLVSEVSGKDNTQAVEQSILTSLEALKNQNFCVRETFEGSYEMGQVFGASLAERISLDLETMRQRVEMGEDRDAVEKELLDDSSFNSWYEALIKEMAGKTDGQKIHK